MLCDPPTPPPKRAADFPLITFFSQSKIGAKNVDMEKKTPHHRSMVPCNMELNISTKKSFANCTLFPEKKMSLRITNIIF